MELCYCKPDTNLSHFKLSCIDITIHCSMPSIILSIDEVVTSISNVCTSFHVYMTKDSSDWIFVITVLTFLISILCTAKVYKRKRRELFIVCQDSHFNLKVASSLSLKIGDYEPPWWYNRHFGTMIPFGYNPGITYEREIFTEEDACFAVDWFPRKPDIDTTLGRTIKICVFYPGLGLGSQNVITPYFSYCYQIQRTISLCLYNLSFTTAFVEICPTICSGYVEGRILLGYRDITRSRHSIENFTVCVATWCIVAVSLFYFFR
jgi:hypothetical protein